MEKKYLGIDVGGTRIKIVALNQNRVILDKQVLDTTDDPDHPEHWKNKVVEIINLKTEELADGNCEKLICGISAPGLADQDNRCILHMPERLSGIENFLWASELNREVWVLNDAYAATLAEYELFFKNEVNNMLLLTLGTGVGGGVILNGQLIQGAIGRAGAFGHITVDHKGVRTMTNIPGSLEYSIGDFSVANRTYGHYDSTTVLVKAYEDGNTLATYWWLESIQKLATGLASLINAFSPELIVLGGGIAGAGKSLFDPLEEFMDLYEWCPGGYKVPIKTALSENYAGAIGAALFSSEMHMNKQPQ